LRRLQARVGGPSRVKAILAPDAFHSAALARQVIEIDKLAIEAIGEFEGPFQSNWHRIAAGEALPAPKRGPFTGNNARLFGRRAPLHDGVSPNSGRTLEAA
jgi:hypothetical protein